MSTSPQRLAGGLAAHLETAAGTYAAALFDIDGTLLRGGGALPGAPGLLSWLRAARLPFLLLTNDGNHSTTEKAGVLARAGLAVTAEEIVSCADAIVDFVAERDLRGREVFIMGDLGAPCYAERAGLRPTRSLPHLADCAGVIIGEANYDWESTFNAVINFFIHRPEAFLVVPNPDSYWPGRHGEIHIGAGGKARFLQMILADYGVRLDPHYLGKPNAAIFRRALTRLAERHGLDRPPETGRVLVVGDSLASDIRGGNGLGFVTALVLTGITTPEQAARSDLPAEQRPALVFPHL